MGKYRDHEYDDELDDEPSIIIERRSASASSFLWGLALGAGVALLLAPRSGEETREEIRRRAGRVKTAARDVAEDIGDSVRDSYDHARRSVEDKIDAARYAIELKKQQAQDAIRAGREAAQQARNELERRISETKAAYQAGAEVVRTGRPDGGGESGGEGGGVAG